MRTFRDGDIAAGMNSSHNSIHAGLSTNARGNPAPATSRTTNFSKSCWRARDHVGETADSREDGRRLIEKEAVRKSCGRPVSDAEKHDPESEGAGLPCLELRKGCRVKEPKEDKAGDGG